MQRGWPKVWGPDPGQRRKVKKQNGKESDCPSWRLKPNHESQRKAGDERDCQQKPNRSFRLPPSLLASTHFPEVLAGRHALQTLHPPGRFGPAAPKGEETQVRLACGLAPAACGEPRASNPAPFKDLRKLSSAGKALES